MNAGGPRQDAKGSTGFSLRGSPASPRLRVSDRIPQTHRESSRARKRGVSAAGRPGREPLRGPVGGAVGQAAPCSTRGSCPAAVADVAKAHSRHARGRGSAARPPPRSSLGPRGSRQPGASWHKATLLMLRTPRSLCILLSQRIGGLVGFRKTEVLSWK